MILRFNPLLNQNRGIGSTDGRNHFPIRLIETHKLMNTFPYPLTFYYYFRSDFLAVKSNSIVNTVKDILISHKLSSMQNIFMSHIQFAARYFWYTYKRKKYIWYTWNYYLDYGISFTMNLQFFKQKWYLEMLKFVFSTCQQSQLLDAEQNINIPLYKRGIRAVYVVYQIYV